MGWPAPHNPAQFCSGNRREDDGQDGNCGARHRSRHGVIHPKRRAPLVKRLDELMASELSISQRALRLIEDLRDEWAELDRRIGTYDDELASLTREDEMARRLATVPGIGVINATALLAAVGDGSAFARGRNQAAWLGLSPRQHSTGGKIKLLGISKRGNSYLRTQLIFRPVRSTAQAMRASLTATATATTLGCALAISWRTQLPVAVCFPAKWAIAAGAPWII
jgi:transposase